MSLCNVHCTPPIGFFFTSQHYFFAVTSVPCIYSRVFPTYSVHFCVNASCRCLYPCLHCCYFHTLLGLINDFRNGCCSTFTICGPRVWKLISIYQKCTNAYHINFCVHCHFPATALQGVYKCAVETT